MPDESGQMVEVPAPVFRDTEEDFGPRPARAKTGDARVRGVKEVAGFAQHVAKRILRLADSLQMRVEVIEKLEGRELLFRRRGHAGRSLVP